MRGGVTRWKRGVRGEGITSAAAYAFTGGCDATRELTGEEATEGTLRAAEYAGTTVERFVATDDGVSVDHLGVKALQSWISGNDPETGELRGRDLRSPSTDLMFDATINAPKSFSLVAILHPELTEAYEALQDRLRDHTIQMWQRELNARRGKGGAVREDLARIEVVELRHERSRSLDAHKHRHLWLNARVQGRDGQWSSLDSRVMLRLQNVVNAEGDLAARTDPEWLAALAGHGYTLNEDGEVAELASIVRPLSRRSNQIEANRSAKLTEWRREHPGQEPDHAVLRDIDRWAWAHQRPNKPGQLDEAEWADTVRREIADLDPALLTAARSPLPVEGARIAQLDRDDLAARAVADADRRSASSGGRFSDFDIRAGAIRAIAASGLVADRAAAEELIEDVVDRALRSSTVSLHDEDGLPAHVKHRMATHTFATKMALADQYERLTGPGEVVEVATVSAVAADVLPAERQLDAGQADAAAAIGGTDRLVTVTGPAGTGKTTMLRVARTLLENQKRRMVIVAPTKKAASVAGAETGADASSLHALLHDHGFRWSDTPTGQHWTRLVPGETDPVTGQVFDGAQKYELHEHDRIVVDEAGMVDLNTASALATIAAETGAGIAMVGDHLQALPVGHSGAMSLMRTRSSAVVELSAVHRFTTTDETGKTVKDTAWADLSLRIREPGNDSAAVAHQIIDSGHAVLVATEADARQHMVDEWMSSHARRQRVALVTATHDEAQAISEAIQARRIDAGQLKVTSSCLLQSGQLAYVGDIVQTRRNDRDAEVENRQTWTISSITTDAAGRVSGAKLMSVEDSGITRTVDADYLAEHTHLSYAMTVHGVQGETTDRALVGPGVDAAGLYVGLTRGKRHNAAVLIADSDREAREQLIQTMQRGRVEATIDDSRAAARDDLAHAARRPAVPTDDGPSTGTWDDRKVRPLGHIEKLEELLADAVERERALFEHATRLAEKIAVDQAALDEVNIRLASWEARAHAARNTGAEPGDAPVQEQTRLALEERLQAARAERAEVSREYAKTTRRVQMAHRELSIREQLGPEMGAYESAARRRRRAERFTREIPAWNDREHRPFGRERALSARIVATKNTLSELAAERDEWESKLQTVRTMLRTDTGPNGVQLTAEQRQRVSELLETATARYDRAVAAHAKQHHLQGLLTRERDFRAVLDAEARSRSERVAAIAALLETNTDDHGDVLTPAGRTHLVDESRRLQQMENRAELEHRQRHDAATVDRPSSLRPTEAGPSIG